MNERVLALWRFGRTRAVWECGDFTGGFHMVWKFQLRPSVLAAAVGARAACAAVRVRASGAGRRAVKQTLGTAALDGKQLLHPTNSCRQGVSPTAFSQL